MYMFHLFIEKYFKSKRWRKRERKRGKKEWREKRKMEEIGDKKEKEKRGGGETEVEGIKQAKQTWIGK